MAVALAGASSASGAATGFTRTHRASTATSSQVNHFQKMFISDLALGRASGFGSVTLPRDGLGDIVGLTTSTSGGQTPGVYRIIQQSPGYAPWTRTSLAGTNRPLSPAHDLTTTPNWQPGHGDDFYFDGEEASPANLYLRWTGSEDEFVRDSHGEYSTARQLGRTPVSIAYGQIDNYWVGGTSGLITLLDNDDVLLLSADGSTDFWDWGESYLARPPAGAPRVCGGTVLAGDVTGDGQGDIVQYGTRCGGGDSGFQVWEGQAGQYDPIGTPDAASFAYRGYVSLGTGLQSMQLGDLNGDGHDDMAFTFAASTTTGPGSYAVALYDPSSTVDTQPAGQGQLHLGFTPGGDDTPQLHPVTGARGGPSGGAGALQIADVAAPGNPSAATDGRPDLVIAQPQSGKIVVLANGAVNPGHTFTTYGTPIAFGDGSAGSGPDGLTLGKVDTDDRLDLVAWSNATDAAEWDVFLGARAPAVALSSSATADKALEDTTVTFTASVTPPAGSPQDATVDHVDWDFDGDGTVDQTTTAPTVDHAFTTIGDQDVTATVVTASGDSVTAHLPTALRIGTPLRVTVTPNPSSTTPGTPVEYTANVTGGYPGPGGAQPTYNYAFYLDQNGTAQPDATHAVLNVEQSKPMLRAVWSVPTRGRLDVVVRDDQGSVDVGVVFVRVADPLTVSFVPQDGHNLMAGEAGTLVATAGGGIGDRHVEWDLDGDGTYETDTGTATTTPVTFPTAGEPTVGVRVTDADPQGGVSESSRHTVIVRPALTAAIRRLPAVPVPGDAMTFDAGDSTGGEPAGAMPYTYEWTVDDTVSSQTGSVLTHAFTDAAHHTVGLKITDAYGRTASTDEAFKVAAPLTPGFATTPADPQLNEAVHFDPAATSGGIAPYTYRWDLDGDGTYDPGETGAAPTHTYTTRGIFPVKLEVTDADGVTAETTRPVGIAAELTADLRVLPAQPAPGTAVTFDASTTVGGTQPYTYAWTIDGTPQAAAGDNIAQLQRTFAQPGHHTVGLTVTDGASRTSTVAPKAFKVAAPVTAAFTSLPGLPQTGEQVDLDAAGSAGGIPPLRYDWDLDGDGTYESSTAAATAQHVTFVTAGVKPVGLRVTDADGVEATVAHNVQVAPALTAALAHSPAIPVPGQAVTLDASASAGGAGTAGFGFDLDGSGAFTTLTGATPTASTAFTTIGDHPVAVQVKDAGGHAAVAHDVVPVADPLLAALTLSPDHPETGDTVTLDASGSTGGAGTRTFSFDRDGDGVADTDASPDATTTVTVDRPGITRFGVVARDTHGQHATTVGSTDVTPRLVPAFSVPPIVSDDLPATLDATATRGGAAPLRLRWDLDGNGSYETDAGTALTKTASFPKVGTSTVGLQVTDALGHSRTVRKSFAVVEGCIQSVTYGVTHITTPPTVCMRRAAGSTTLTAGGNLVLNGMTIVRTPGSTLQVIPASGDDPPQLVGSAVQVKVDDTTIVDGAISWQLPTDTDGADHSIGGVTDPPSGSKLLGLPAVGRVTLALGAQAGGTPYVRVGANLEIPSLKLTSLAGSPSVTSKVTFRVDAAGEHKEGLYLKVDNAKLKGLLVKDLCLSYVVAGQTGDGCPQFQDPRGEPFMSCPTNNTTDRWSGTMDVTLPIKGGTGLAFSGELQNGQIANMAAKATLGKRVPLATGVYLRSIAAGVCLTPSPLKIKGQAVVSALHTPVPGAPPGLTVDGSFLYTDPSGSDPWTIDLQGGLTILGRNIADGTARITGDDEFSAGFHQRLQLPTDDINVASIEGGINGWIKGSSFNFEGDVDACLAGVFCIGGDALVSSDGIAACVTIATIYYPIVDAGWLYAHVSYGSYDLKGGFGYRWGGGVDVMGGSCDIGPWRPAGAPSARSHTRAVSRVAAPTAPYTLTVKPDSLAETLRLHGAGAAPAVTVTGPDGTSFRLPAMETGTRTPQGHMIVQDPTTATTVVQLIKPAAGTWTITPDLGSSITGVDTAQVQPPPSIGGRVRHDKAGYHLDYAYTPQAGVAFAFTERRGNAVQQVGAGKDTTCPTTVERRNAADVTLRCGTLDFKPADGPGGRRDLEVQMTRDGIPLSTVKVASYIAPKPVHPGAVHRARLSRTGGRTFLGWQAARRAATYEIAATSTEGYRRLYVMPATCRRLLLPATRTTDHADTRITAVGRNGRRGPTVRLHLHRGDKRAGSTVAYSPPSRAMRVRCQR